MGHLEGLQAYLDEGYHISVFDGAVESGQSWEIHRHGRRIIRATVLENQTYDVKLRIDGRDEDIVPKVEIKLLYEAKLAGTINPFIRMDKKVEKMGLGPIYAPRYRYHVKNKTLFPLMKEREVLFFTLLEGEVIRGIVEGFSRYEIAVHMKGGIPVTILRHSIYDVRNKKGRCFLKSSQENSRDWEKSPFFVGEKPDSQTLKN